MGQCLTWTKTGYGTFNKNLKKISKNCSNLMLTWAKVIASRVKHGYSSNCRTRHTNFINWSTNKRQNMCCFCLSATFLAVFGIKMPGLMLDQPEFDCRIYGWEDLRQAGHLA